MNVARLLITKIVDGQDIKPVLNAGFDKAWLRDPDSAAVFDGPDKAVFIKILDHHKKYKEIPDREQILEEYDPTYKFKETDRSLPWLLDYATKTYIRGITDQALAEVVEYFDADDITEAIESARHLVKRTDSIGRDEMSVVVVNEMAENVWDFLDREREEGIPFGIESIDENFGGFQPGQLITLLGRNKGMKTWLMIKSAVTAWENGYDSVFFSVELSSEQIQMRMLAALAEVSYDRMRKQDLRNSERQAVDKAAARLAGDDVLLQIERNAFSLSIKDLRASIQKNRPHIVFVDGFYFMTDTETKKSAVNWEAHENLAKDLKILAEQEGVVIVTSTQVQEKQHNNRSGVEGRTMMGGTGLIKASDLVLGIDKPDDSDRQVISMIANRESEPITTCLLWDFDNMTFEEVENFEPDEAEFELA